MTSPTWSTEQLAPNVHVIRFEGITAGWSQDILLTADRHWDNPHSDQKLQLAHLKKAKQTNAPIIDIGDFFCLMQGKYDPRKNMDELREEHRREDYFDAILETAENFFAPYAEQFAVIGMGNHETSVLKRNQINMTNNFTRRLRDHSHTHAPHNGQYGGWVFIRCHINKTRQQTIRIKYHHGYGGGGPVTKGIIQTNRRAVYQPDADIIVTGHIHEAWPIPIMRERVTNGGRVFIEPQWHISLPTYKDEYAQGQGGYHIENGRPPKPIGCAWLELSLPENSNEKRIATKITLDI